MNGSSSTPPPLAGGQIEIWKKIVDVQQHFNDLELRIRNFALIVTGAFLGLGGYAIKDAGIISIYGLNISVAGMVVISAIFPLFAFYFMDRLWYHRLLDGAVKAGIEAERALEDMGYQVNLGLEIKNNSPFVLWFTSKTIHSKTKMDIFYGMLALTLLILGLTLAFGVRMQSATTPVLNHDAAITDSAQVAPNGPNNKAPNDDAEVITEPVPEAAQVDNPSPENLE